VLFTLHLPPMTTGQSTTRSGTGSSDHTAKDWTDLRASGWPFTSGAVAPTTHRLPGAAEDSIGLTSVSQSQSSA